VLVMASAYRSYAHHHPGRYSAFTRMPLGIGEDPEYTAATRAAAAPVIAVLSSYGLNLEQAFFAALEFWSAMHGFVLLEMTGVMDDIDTDALFSDMVLRLATGMEHRSGSAAHSAAQRRPPGRRTEPRNRVLTCLTSGGYCGGSCLAVLGASPKTRTPGQFACQPRNGLTLRRAHATHPAAGDRARV
jgi:hypothetical protein